MVKTPIKTTGGRYYTASKIVKLFPPKGSYQNYLEPMFRSGAVLFAHDPANCSEVINDLDQNFTNFFRVLQDEYQFERFQRKIEAVAFSGIEFMDAVERLRTDASWSLEPEVNRAVDLFIAANMSFGGNQETFSPVTKTRLRRGMNEQVSAWLTKIEGLPRVHARLKRVLILQLMDVFELLPEWDRADTVIYLDPPWLMEEDNPDTRATTNLYGIFDWDAAQHMRLLESLRFTRKASILLSGFDSRLYERILVQEHHWRKHAFDVPLHSAGGKQKRRQQEMLWTNF